MFSKRLVYVALGALLAPMGVFAQDAAAPAAAPAAGEPTANAPRIFSPEPVFDFGSQDNEGKVQHDFTIMNVGTGQLDISDVKSSCGCTVAELAKKSLAPGEETKISATFNLSGKQGPQTKVISVSSNDPDVPVYKLELKGNAVAAIEVEPRFVNYGSVSEENLPAQTITIKSNKDDISFNVTAAEVSAPEFKAEVKTVAEGKHFEIVLSNVEPLKPGIAQGVINVRTDNPKHSTIPVRYHANIVGDLEVVPNQINLRYTEEGTPTQQYMKVGPGRVKEFKVLEVVTPIPEMEAEIIARGANNYNIRLGKMPTDNTLDGKELIIKTDVPSSAEIKVPFRVMKLPNVDGTATIKPQSLKPATPPAPGGEAAPAAPPAEAPKQ